ncbi:MAG: hypothetical protein RJA70_3818, partial [Pseudomonadota bacterium]
MSIDPDLFEGLRNRVNEHLSLLNVKLRSQAVTQACSRVADITAGDFEGDAVLTLALCRAAIAAMSAWSNQVKSSAQSGGSPVELEQAFRQQAQLVDEAQVSLSAARSMLGQLRPSTGAGGKLDTNTVLMMCVRLSEPGYPILVREPALALISATLRFLSQNERQIAMGISALRSLRRHASGTSAEGFVQAAALRAMWDAEGDACQETAFAVLREQFGARGMVARHAAVQLLVGRRSALQGAEVLRLCRNDPSEHVRQGLVRALAARFDQLNRSESANNEELQALLGQCHEVFRDDPSPRVRGLVLVELERLARNDVLAAQKLEQLMTLAASAEEGLLQRAVLFVGERLFHEEQHGLSARNVAAILSILIRVMAPEATPDQLDRSEKAASLLLRLESKFCSQGGPLLRALQPLLTSLPEGKTLDVELKDRRELPILERVLYSLSCEDFPLTIRSVSATRVSVRKGERRAFKVWRALHELSHPAPDKRPGFPHTRGLVNDGGTLVVPLRMAEVAKTSVPGERQSVLGDSWGGFVPRAEDALACCTTRRGARRLLTAFGVIELSAPKPFLGRLFARWLLTIRFAHFAALRANSLLGSGAQRAAYVSRLRALGFGLKLSDASVVIRDEEFGITPKFIRPYLSLAPYPLVLWLEDALQYALAPSGNTALQLAACVWVVLVYMLGRAAWAQQRFEAARERVPLSIGGWGSRGKSGTERLK